jgi:hypothetical protein
MLSGALVAVIIGALVASGRWLLGRWRSMHDSERALRALARNHHAMVHGDGHTRALHVVGVMEGRAFTVAWQADLIRGQTLLIAVDCNVTDDVPASEATVQDGAIASRIQTPEHLDAARLETMLAAMLQLAADLEHTHPAAVADAEG